jgi:hypothetical protein
MSARPILTLGPTGDSSPLGTMLPGQEACQPYEYITDVLPDWPG